jgi:hypothetical protein
MNLGNIRTHFKALLNRSDITDALADTFIDQGIARVQRSLRIPSMEKQYNYSITSPIAEVILPNDFLEAISIYFDGRQLAKVTLPEILERQQNGEQGAPLYFCRQGGTYLISPSPSSGTLSLDYYAQFIDMTADSDENILAQVASDLIIYAALTYAADYYIDERSPVFENKYVQFMAEIQEQSNDAETSGNMQTIRPSLRHLRMQRQQVQQRQLFLKITQVTPL